MSKTFRLWTRNTPPNQVKHFQKITSEISCVVIELKLSSLQQCTEIISVFNQMFTSTVKIKILNFLNSKKEFYPFMTVKAK